MLVLSVPFSLMHHANVLDVSGMVYEDAEKLYAEVRKDGEALLEEAFNVLFPNSVALTQDTNPKAIPVSSKIVGYNTTFFPRSDIIEIPLFSGTSAQLKSQVLQTSIDGKVGYAVMDCSGGGSVGALCTPADGLHGKITPVSGEKFSCVYSFSFKLIDLVSSGSVYEWLGQFCAEELERAAYDFKGPDYQSIGC